MAAYSELSCQICSVSFNIARHRTSDEPESQGWDYLGARTFERDPSSSLCSLYHQDSGCENLKLEHGLLEHIAGPGCVFEGGYSGYRIGVEEMEGINKARYVVKKPYRLDYSHLRNHHDVGTTRQGTNQDGINRPEDGDGRDDDNLENYERESKWFLTASTIEPPLASRKNLSHTKFGIQGDNIWATNSPDLSFWKDGEGIGPLQTRHSGFPVHQACWKIFEMVSLQKLGRVDIDGFAALWCREACRGCGFQDTKHDAVLAECKSRWWSHKVGSEYLAANPVQIPGFRFLMRGSYREESPAGDGSFAEGKFRRLEKKMSSQDVLSKFSDPFCYLPSEIKNDILAHLCPRDIASLRLASSCFRQLPKALFRILIKKQMPWFWELDDLKKEEEKFLIQSFQESYGEYIHGLDDVVHPHMLAFVKAQRVEKYLDTNWLQVYKKLKVVEKGALGVRNRSRIWKVVENVVGRIEKMVAKEGFEGTVTGSDFPIWPSGNENIDMYGPYGHRFHRCPGCSENS